MFGLLKVLIVTIAIIEAVMETIAVWVKVKNELRNLCQFATA